MPFMTIGQLAKKAGLPRTTIRFYEKLGLLKPERNSANYRRYNHRSTEKLELILEARRMGLSLRDIKELNGALGSRTLQVVQDRLQNLGDQIERLIGQRRRLARTLRHLRRNPTGGLSAFAPRKGRREKKD